MRTTSCRRCDGVGVVIEDGGFLDFEAKVVACPRCSGMSETSPSWLQRAYRGFQLWLERLIGRDIV